MGEHPARAAAQRCMDLETRKGEGAKQAWLALFDDDALIEDPVGPSPLDPEGKGYRGKEAIAAFWDAFIEPVCLEFAVRASYAAGDEVANVGTITARVDGRVVATVEGVFTYRVNAAGKIVAFRTYWELDRLQASEEGLALLDKPG